MWGENQEEGKKKNTNNKSYPGEREVIEERNVLSVPQSSWINQCIHDPD